MKLEKYNDSQEISPEEIKEIRRFLRLSQTEAGELLGGGPSAFAKYERGSVKPSAALVRILRFLRKRPEELGALSGQEPRARRSAINPFDVASEHVSALKPPEFSALVEKLLSAEALQKNLPLDGIHVAFNITVSDGGEDARIEWLGGPERTGFLPSRFCQFQLKTGKVSPKKAGEEVLARKNGLKPMVREALEKGASYIMLCSKPYTQKQIDNRLDSLRRNLEDHGFKDASVQFRDSGQIASWVNYHPCVAAWLLRKTRPDLINPSVGDWEHLFDRPEHRGSPWVDDPRLPDFRGRLRTTVGVPKGVARVVGPPGTGKSRLVFEALGPTETEMVSGVKLSDLVLYAIESEIGPHEIKKYARNLANSGKRAVLVVDGCSEETRIDLTNITKHSNSGLSLVTIETGTRGDAPESGNTLFVKVAENMLIEEIIKSQAPHISARDRKRIADFSGGVITFARITAKSWDEGVFMPSDDEDEFMPSDDEDELLIRKFIIGHYGPESDPVYETAKLISVFGGVRMGTSGDELKQVARFGSHPLRQDFQTYVNKLRNRGVVCMLPGRFATLTPKHIAVRLARSQWEEWDWSQWEETLVSDGLSKQLRVRAAEQLALLNRWPVALEIARHILGNQTLWSSPENLKCNLKLLSCLAQIDPERVADLLEDMLRTSEPQVLLNEEINHDLVEILGKIVFAKKTFENAATLLLKLACLEDEPSNCRARDLFVSLFPVHLASTEAGPEKRLQVIDEHINEDDHTLLSVIVATLSEGTKTALFSRTIAGEGPETHGNRPVLESWSPRGDEGLDYIRRCTERLVRLAKRHDGIGEAARDVLGQNLYGYIVNCLLIEDTERWLLEVKEEHPYWPEALVALGNILKNHEGRLADTIQLGVEKLISDLEPRGLNDRVQFLLRDMPYGHFYRKTMDGKTRLRIEKEKVEQLAEDLLDCETELERLIPGLCAGGQGMTVRLLGLSLAKKAEKPLRWKKRIMDEFEAISNPHERNHDLLVGYMEGLKGRDRKEFRKFKEHAKTSPVFAPMLPALMFYTGISPEDIKMTVEALEAGLITHEEISAWNYRNKLSELRPADMAPLFDLLLKKGGIQFFEAGLKLMFTYLHENDQFLNSLHTQLQIASKYLSVIKDETSRESLHLGDSGNPGGNFAGEQNGNTSMGIDDREDIEGFLEQPKYPTAGFEYETLMNRILSRGGENPDARAVAITIAKQIAEEGNGLYYLDLEIIKSVLPDLLSGFGEIVWPLIASAMQKNRGRFLDMMGNRWSSCHEPPHVLHLPEDTLFGWCHANPDIGPALVAETVPLLTSAPEKKEETSTSEKFHPLIRRLLDEFGDRPDVLDALESRINTPKWTYPVLSAREDHPASYRKSLHAVKDHDKGTVRRWAGKMLRKIDDENETL